MNDQVLMCILQCGAYPANQRHPCAHGQLVLVGISRDGNALDVLHHEIRQIVVGTATIEQAYDAGMLEPRKDLALVAKPRDRLGRADRVRQDLDRDAVIELSIVALGEVHGTHTTLAEEPGQTKRTDSATDVRSDGSGGEYLDLCDDGLAQRRVRLPQAPDHPHHPLLS